MDGVEYGVLGEGFGDGVDGEWTAATTTAFHKGMTRVWGGSQRASRRLQPCHCAHGIRVRSWTEEHRQHQQNDDAARSVIGQGLGMRMRPGWVCYIDVLRSKYGRNTFTIWGLWP